jgi:hypothetical protein
MKISELNEMGLSELSEAELSGVQGGTNIIYDIAYAVGFVVGTGLKVAEKVADSLLYNTITSPLK